MTAENWVASSDAYRILTEQEIAVLQLRREPMAFDWVDEIDPAERVMAGMVAAVTVFAALMTTSFLVVRALMWAGLW